MKFAYPTGKAAHALLILIVCLTAYLNSFQSGFLTDDWDLIVNNAQISQPHYLLYEFFPGLNPEPSTRFYYRPLLSAVIAVSYGIFGFKAWGYHLINWILFYCVCLSVYSFVRVYFQNSTLALTTALLFVVHPFNGFIVNNISAGVIGLQMIFLCWAAIFFKWFDDTHKDWRYLAFSLILFILALMGHDTALSFSFFLLVLNILFIKSNSPAKSLLRILPYTGLSLIFYFIKTNSSIALHNILGQEAVRFPQYVASVAQLMVWYIKKFLTGEGIVFIWATPTATDGLLAWNSIAFGAVFFLVMGFCSSKVPIVLRLASGWFLLSVLTVAIGSRFEPVHGWIIEPNWLYFPSIANFAVVGSLFLKFREIFPKIISFSTFVIYLGALLLNNWSLNHLWADEKRYCTYWAGQAPGFTTPLSFLASAYIREGNLTKGEEILREALKRSEQPILLYKLGMIDYTRKHWEEAERYFKRALVLQPHSATLRLVLEEIEEKKRSRGALQGFREEGRPTLPKAPYVLTQTAKKWHYQNPDLVFVDVRAPEEYQTGHIEGALNIPYDQIEARAGEFRRDRMYIFYCIYSSWRAPYAANVLADLGHTNVYVLEGGVSAWNAGGQVIYPKSAKLKTENSKLRDAPIQIAPYPKDLPKILTHPPDQEYSEKIYLTLEELKEFDGKDGRPAYVAVNGVIYDVTQSRLWRGGEHDPSHGEAKAGRDLTEVLKLSPHGPEHLERFPIVGSLKEMD